MRKILITKKEGCAKVEEVNRDILGISNSYSLNKGKPADFKQALPYALFPVHVSVSNPSGSRQHTVKSNLSYIYCKTWKIIPSNSLQIMELL